MSDGSADGLTEGALGSGAPFALVRKIPQQLCCSLRWLSHLMRTPRQECRVVVRQKAVRELLKPGTHGLRSRIPHDFSAEQALGRALTYRSVTLELFFFKDLIQNSLVWKTGVPVPIVQDVLRLRSS